MEEKIIHLCPLTGKELSLENNWECFEIDCSHIDANKKEYIFGRSYRCIHERHIIEKWHDAQQKAAMISKRFENSLKAAREININDFYDYCENLDTLMINNKQLFSDEISVKLFHETNEKSLIYIFNADKVINIVAVDNPLLYLSKSYNLLRDTTQKYSISVCSVNETIAEAIIVKLRLRHRIEIPRNIHYGNPVYIKGKNLKKYIETAYSGDYSSFKNLLKKQLDLTEIVDSDDIIFVKQELDELIRREYLLQKQ